VVAHPTRHISTVVVLLPASSKLYHYLHEQYISRLGSLNLEWSRKVMDLREVDIFHVISAVIVS
jgi:hypothetical protein